MTAETSNARWEWVLVPRVPTEAMLDAMHSRIRILCDPAECTAAIQNDREVWAAMLAAAPPAPVSVPLDRLTALDGLVDRIAEAIRDGDGLAEGDPPWERLGEERRAPWRADAKRALSVIKESLTAAGTLAARTSQPPDAEVRALPAKWRDRAANNPGSFAAAANVVCADELEAALAAEGVQAEPKPEARSVVDEGSRSVTSQLLHWGGIPVYVTGTVTTSPGNWPLIDAALTEATMSGKPIDEAVLDRACEAYAEIAGDYMGLVRIRAMREALTTAQQPAIGEEIMVNAAHGVFTLPLHPSGLSSGPRFVVHVPAPEQQPASPSGAVNVVGMPEFDGLMDHIYEYGTTAEGVVERANAFARAVLAQYAPQQPAAVDGAVGTVTRVGEFEVQEHRIELDPEFDERLNNMPAGTVVRLYAAPVRDLTQKQLADAAAALATQHQEPKS